MFVALLLTANFTNIMGQNISRTINELAADTSGWEDVKYAMKIARNKFEILPADPLKAKEALHQLQVTTRSPMGAIVYLTGGILIDNGWIRILGSGSKKLNRSLPEWNLGKNSQTNSENLKFLLVADDAIGGFFALNGGAFGKDLGQIYYLAPDRLKWEAQHMSYSDFINFCFVGDMDQYYDGLRWPTWKKDLLQVSGDKSFYFYPYLWTKEGKDIKKDKRTIVPVNEVYIFETDELKQH